MRDVVTGFYLNVLRRLWMLELYRPPIVCWSSVAARSMRRSRPRSASRMSSSQISTTKCRTPFKTPKISPTRTAVLMLSSSMPGCITAIQPHRAAAGNGSRGPQMRRRVRSARQHDDAARGSRFGLTLGLRARVPSPRTSSSTAVSLTDRHAEFRLSLDRARGREDVASYDPAHVTDIRFFYDLRLPIQRLARSGAGMMRAVTTLVEPLSKAFAKVLPSQCNEFAFAIWKTANDSFGIES